MTEPPDWFGELGQTLADIVDELKILGHNTKPFALRIDAAMYKAARARDREIIEREGNDRLRRESDRSRREHPTAEVG